MNGPQHAGHVDFEILNDYVDGTLAGRAATEVERHLAACRSCSSERDALRSMLQSTTDLPKSVLPDDDLWPDLKRALETRKVVALPSTAVRSDAPPVTAQREAGRWRTRGLLAAAAVVLVTASSAITTLVVRRSDQARSIAIALDSVPRASRARSALLPVGFRQAEMEYNRTIEELQLAVNTQRSRLSPETIRTVDHSLAVVDSAITEARAALLADPNNGMLVDLLSASYQRKLDLLRRTSELSSKI